MLSNHGSDHSQSEGRMILRTAEMLQFPADQAYTIIVGMAQAGGFRAEVILRCIAANLRRSLSGGGAAGDTRIPALSPSSPIAS
jgi:hypothetical protein